MTNRDIHVTLSHFEDSDYECKHSKLKIQMDESGDNPQVFELTGMTAESAFRLITEIIHVSVIEENDKNSKED